MWRGHFESWLEQRWRWQGVNTETPRKTHFMEIKHYFISISVGKRKHYYAAMNSDLFMNEVYSPTFKTNCFIKWYETHYLSFRSEGGLVASMFEYHASHPRSIPIKLPPELFDGL